VIAAVVAMFWIYGKLARRSSAYRSGFRPQNSSLLVRLYRLHRADKGESDPQILHSPRDIGRAAGDERRQGVGAD